MDSVITGDYATPELAAHAVILANRVHSGHVVDGTRVLCTSGQCS